MSLEKAVALCDHYVASHDCKMKWMWGEGLLGSALGELEDYLGDERYLDFLKGYCDHYYENRPVVASSDTSAPGLITYYLWKKTGSSKAKELTDAVITYMRDEPRVLDGLVNHMGHSGYNTWYPASVWVDSLMMFGVFAGIYGEGERDDAFTDMAAKQPIRLAQRLMDGKTSLWYHSYWLSIRRHYPLDRVFWGRGNAWVISSLPKILDRIGDCPEATQIKEILLKTAEAVLKFQKPDGSFCTILGRFGVYKESSATALIAGGLMHAVRKGYLPDSFAEPALKAYEWVDGCVVKKDDGYVMTGISGPTIPMFVSPWLGYALVPRGNDWSYGIAAYVWASMEYDKTYGDRRHDD